MTAPIRIGFLGGGMIAQIAHIPFYAADPRCRVVAVCEQRPSLHGHLASLAPGARIVASHRDLLAMEDVDAVVVSAPRPATGPLTLDALRAGKHVLAEKPMAHTSEQAARLVAAARERGLVYAVGFMKRHDPGIEAGRALVARLREEGRHGRLLSARFFDHSRVYAVAPPPHRRPAESRTERFETWPTAPEWLPERLRDAYAWYMNAASHDVNLMRLFFPGRLDLAWAAANGQDAATAAFLADDGVPVTLEASRCAAGRWIEGAEFVFEGGRVRLDVPSPMAVDAATEVVLDDGRADGGGGRIETAAGWSFARQATAFVDALLGLRAPGTTGEQAAEEIGIAEAVWKRIAGLT
jgi:predicted dehydrogenase